ncbi:hypothetical protein VNO80_22865 [Phaseolus coccineus]|uniref:Uncharacterized protein n=1 Tax=Phaseolus coccineus TaxID=3886 RepID=A0AAN9M5X8_PHACN
MEGMVEDPKKRGFFEIHFYREQVVHSNPRTVLYLYNGNQFPPVCLCLGSIGTAVNKDALKDHNITHVLTVSGRIPPPHPDDFFYQIIDVVANLMRTCGMILFEALQLVRCIRPEACPNQGFLCQLEDFEEVSSRCL